MKDKQWFIECIGKKVFRDTNKCNCQVCVDVFNNGLVISDENHANYLFDIQNELGYNYIDARERIDILIQNAYKTDTIERIKWRIKNREALRAEWKRKLQELIEKDKQENGNEHEQSN